MADKSSIDLMRHALGVQLKGGKWTKPCRNYYVAGDDCVRAWDELVRQGHAQLIRKASELSGGAPTYSVTERGQALALAGLAEGPGGESYDAAYARELLDALPEDVGGVVAGETLVPMRSEATGGGDYDAVCTGCDQSRADPHTWKQCADAQRKIIEQIDASLVAAASGLVNRANFLPAPQVFLLEQACALIVAAYGSHPYLVGSCLERRDYRDVDVRLILDDEVFEDMFPGVTGTPRLNALWSLTCLTISLWLEKQSGLPVDFQIQQRTAANAEFGGKRSALGLYHEFAGGPKKAEDG